MTDRSAAALEAQESFEVHKEKVDLLHSKAVGLLGVLFLTVTGAAPMSAMLGNVPFAAGFGNGIYIPAAFLLATIVLTIFSVGFAAMAQKVSSVGGFYSYISLGLGRDMGMAAGMASFVSIACSRHRSAASSPTLATHGSRRILALMSPGSGWQCS